MKICYLCNDLVFDFNWLKHLEEKHPDEMRKLRREIDEREQLAYLTVS